jgi:hypothetical protein
VIIREARKNAFFGHGVLSRGMSLGQGPQKATMLNAFLAVEHVFTLVDMMEQQGRVV